MNRTPSVPPLGASMAMRAVLYVLAGIGLWFMFFHGPQESSHRVLKAFSDLGHVVLFFLLAALALLQSPQFRSLSLPRQLLYGVLGAAGLGLLTEVLQTLTPDRNFSWWDIASDVLGACLALVLLSPRRRDLRPFTARMLLVFVTVAVVVQLRPLAIAAVDDAVGRWRFPVLADFETPLEYSRWSGGAAFDIGRHGGGFTSRSLTVHLAPHTTSGVTFEHFVRDWRDYDALAMDIANPHPEPFWITLRVHDLHHARDPMKPHDDRFNRRLRLEPGLNRVRIPLEDIATAPRTRPMDLSAVLHMGIFASRLPESRTIHVDHIRLVP